MSVNADLKDRYYLAIASGLGLGLSPFVPGTCAALLGVAAHLLIMTVLPPSATLPALVFTFLAVCAANHLLTPWAERYWRCEDPVHFVLDEIAGYLFVPILFRDGELWKTVVWGFVLFRVFDIFKLIPPARQVDRQLHGPWGILLDDLVSAGYAALIMQMVYWFGPDSWI